MNTATKARIANALTTVVAIVAIIQGGMLTNPPFTEKMIFVLGAVFTYITLAGTAWKQYLSPDVSSTGTKVTIGIAIVATLAGLADLLPIVNLPDTTVQWVKWGISISMMIINILSKQIFPSEMQKDKMYELKFENKK